jgi:hypothetical protein
MHNYTLQTCFYRILLLHMIIKAECNTPFAKVTIMPTPHILKLQIFRTNFGELQIKLHIYEIAKETLQ